jgi:pimeloyl-ACP methyl ester carboxylesterase
MTSRRRRGSARQRRFDPWLVAVSVFLFCCASKPEPALPLPTPPDPPEVQALPGYRAERVKTRSFTGETYVLEAGAPDAPDVVLIHGIGRDGAHDWDELIPALARRHRVLTFDLPGFGRSSSDKGVFGPVSYADLVDELLESRVSGRLDIVAHTMGVSIARVVAMRHGDRVRRMVIADGAGLLHGQSLSLEMIERGQRRLGAFGRLLDPLKWGAYDMTGKIPDHLVHRFALSLGGEAAGQAAARLMAHDSGVALDAVAAPTLVIWGRRDETVSMRGAWVLASRLPQARLAFIDEAGHNPMLETPGPFNDLVSRWLAGEPDVGRALAPALAPASVKPVRDGECRNVRTRIEFTGAYRKLEIEGCRQVTMRGVRARELEINRSTVVAEDLVVAGKEVAVVMWRSRLKLSGGTLSARVPLRLSGSEVDFAGVTFVGEESSVEAIGNAKVLCSLCRLRHEGSDARLHGFRALHRADHL